MAGATVAGKLDGVSFSLASREDDSEIRRLLREVSMGGSVEISMRQEPSYFVERDNSSGEQHTIVARTRGGIAAVGSCAVRRRYVNGVPEQVGYLRTLRLDATMAGRFDVLRQGYRYLYELQRERRLPYLFTSIASDNQRAIRFLEHGLPGMPAYRYLTDFVTLMIPVPGKVQPVGKHENDPLEVIEHLNRRNRDRALSPAWDCGELPGLTNLGLTPSDFVIIREGGSIAGCAALWDQRSYKQTVVHRYRFPLSCQRFVFNTLAPVAGTQRMPPVNQVIPSAYVSHMALEARHVRSAIGALFAIAASKGIKFLILGFAAADPLLSAVRSRFFAHVYKSRFYQVDWPDLPGKRIDSTTIQPEVALL